MTSNETIIPGSSDGDFSEQEWRELTDILRRAEPLFARLAAESKLKVLSSARWPELRLKVQAGWTTSEVRLSLSPRARSRNSENRWVINLVRYPRLAWLPIGQRGSELMSEISDKDVTDGPLLSDHLQNAVRQLMATSSPDRN